MLIFFEQLEVDYALLQQPPIAGGSIILNDLGMDGTPSPGATPVFTDDATMKEYKSDNKAVRGHMLSHVTNLIFDLLAAHRCAKVIWELLEAKYSTDDAGKKKICGKFMQFKMVDDKPIMDQVHEYQNLVAGILAEVMKMCEVLQANRLKDKLVPKVYDNLVKANLVESSENVDRFKKKDKEANFKKDKVQNKRAPNFKMKGKYQNNKLGCFVCGKMGHRAYQCYGRDETHKNAIKPKGDQTKHQVNIVEVSDNLVSMITTAEINHVAEKVE
ncbi:uncharacterized protein LOC131594960 [Vicia villosa]|uniref:uncharacterized protein LOC131594960 n=1 Tax=Vicia villosa TaxID=3911 RepID=UPI00273CD842|nr:uncharacterized protein LOC131594960 [Vicia villosa]